jgi:hypothetical protein
VGGPVIEGRDGAVIGLISHRDDPEGSPLKTATIARLDATHALALVKEATALADGGDRSKFRAIACR